MLVWLVTISTEDKAVAQQRHLRNAPITEAVIYFQANQFSGGFESASAQVVAKLAPDYYQKGSIQQGSLAMAITAGQATPPVIRTATKSIGIRMHSQDEKYVVQILQQGLTVSRLEPYENWEHLRNEMHRIWELYRAELQPTAITRIAVRYVNTILLPIGPGTRLERVFTRPPTEPEGMSDTLSSFLSRCVIEDAPSQASIAVTLASQPPTPQQILPVILDIEAIRQAEFSTSDAAAWDFLERLRSLKNAAFFGSLTEDQVHEYE